MDDKLKRIIYITLGAFAILFLFLLIISSCSKRNIKPKNIESEIIIKAKNYYRVHNDELPGFNSVLTISINDLSSKGIFDINKAVSKDTNCSGYLTIENNNNYYMYSPNIICTSNNETIGSNNLRELLLENIVTSGNGLYQINNSYYFRGDNVNNYLIFDGLLWRIIKINEDNSIKIIEVNKRASVVWDDRYNSEKKSNSGINNYVQNNINSRIKDTIESIYNGSDEKNSLLSDNGKGYIKEQSLCIGKRNTNEIINDGSIECSSRIENQYIGLLQLNDYILASLDSNCTNVNTNSCGNYNYLANFDKAYWTITGNAENTYQIYKIDRTPYATMASNSAMARMVINISENTNVNGTGTIDDPFVISGMSSEIRK